MTKSDIMEERILEYLKKRKGQTEVPSLAAALTEDGGETMEFYRALDRLIKRGEVVYTKKGRVGLAENSGMYKGAFRGSAKGYGFVMLDDGSEIYIPREEVGEAIDGDVVLAVKTPARTTDFTFRNANCEGRVVKVVSHSLTRVTGTFLAIKAKRTRRGAFYIVEPDSKRLSFNIHIDADKVNGAEAGDKVEVELTVYPKRNISAKGVVTQVFGDAGTLGANYGAILHSYGLRTLFPEEVLRHADSVSKETVTPDGRLDLREKLIFTIDGADAKDLDDAISVERDGDSFILGVHIADVSHYVTQDSPADREAFLRGTSVYFTDKVVPMLPKSLSNGSCSLNAGEDKYALSAFMTVDKSGNILSTDVRESVINSRIRGVYSEMNDVFEKRKKSVFYEKYSVLFPDAINDITSLYRLLEKKSRRRGALDLESGECRIILDEEGDPVDIIRVRRGVFERVIEQFMLCANEGVATLMFHTDTPSVYRVHGEPDKEKIKSFSVFASNLGLDITPLSNREIHTSNLSKIVDEAKEKGVDGPLSRVLLRSLMKAKYSSSCSPHFGLALDKYCHFTSPIRRYPDLSVHRILKAMLKGELIGDVYDEYRAFAARSAEASSENELKALYAERDIEDLYKTVYMTKHIGEVYDGVISGVTPFGFYVELENTCEGLVRVSSLDGYFVFSENDMSLSYKDVKYSLGMRVRVEIKDADVITRNVDMELAE